MALDTFFNDARSWVTVISLATFLGIIFWAYSSRRAEAFSEAVNLPFADDALDADVTATERQHG